MIDYDSFFALPPYEHFFRFSRGSKRVKRHLPKAKDSVERSSRPGLDYQIPCQDCTGIYIRESGRAYKTRLAEHKRNLRPANLAKVDGNNFNKKNGIG